MSLNCFQVPADKSCNQQPPQPMNIPDHELQEGEEVLAEYEVQVAEGTHLTNENVGHDDDDDDDDGNDDDDPDATLDSELSQNEGETIICSSQTLNYLSYRQSRMM